MYMITATGARVSMTLADPTSISLLDIAAQLAKINRWNGATSRLYSVAEHSLHVSTVMEREHHISHPGALLAGLMHDAHEAYTTDMPTPHKEHLNKWGDGVWRRFESAAARQVLKRFKVDGHSADWAHSVHAADLVVRATEFRDLLPQGTTPLDNITHIPCSEELRLDDYARHNWQDWRDMFIERFAELHEASKHTARPGSTTTQAAI